MNFPTGRQGAILALLLFSWADPGNFLLAADTEQIDPAPSANEDDRGGSFLPLPIFITEPVTSEGLGVALIYFRGKKQRDERLKITTGREFDSPDKRSKPVPTAAGVFGAYTNDETAAAGSGLRYLARPRQDAQVGLDFVKSPKDVAWYIQMGGAR